MAKRRGEGSGSNAGWPGYFLKAWQGARGLFDHRNVEKTLGGALSGASFYGAIGIFALAALLTFAIMVVLKLESAYLANFMIQTLNEAGLGNMQPLTLESLGPVIAADFLLILPFGIAYEIAVAAASFSILRLMGGKGTLAGHFQLSSVIFLAQSMAMVLALASPLPCFDLLVMAALAAVVVYLSAYVRARAYVAVHQVPFPYAFALALFLLIGSAVVITSVTNALSAFFGLPPVLINIMGA